MSYEKRVLTDETIKQSEEVIRRHNFSIFPTPLGEKSPYPGSAGFKDARPVSEIVYDPEHHNYGVRTGPASGIWVLDIDIYKGGRESAAELLSKHGPLPTTLTVTTRTGGKHIYFRWTKECEVRGITIGTNIMPGIDYRGDGGYAVLPLSFVSDKTDGKAGYYTWDNPDAPIADAPEWLLELCDPMNKKKSPTEYQNSTGKVTASRNCYLTSLAGRYVNQGINGPEHMYSLLSVDNRNNCVPPLDDHEVRNIASSACRNFAEKINVSSDAAVAEWCVEQLKTSHKYHTGHQKWYAKGANGWEMDNGPARFNSALKNVIQTAMMLSSDADTKKAVNKYLNATKHKAVTFYVQQSDEIATAGPGDLKELVVMPRGVINMVSGVESALDDRLYITHTNYNAERMPIPEWTRFLDSIFAPNIKHYMHKLLGYTLSGAKKENICVMLSGVGANGKSTLVETVAYVLGGYAASLDPKHLVETRSSQKGGMDALATLGGKRFVYSSEGPGGLLSEAEVKRLTGNDKIRVEFKHRDSFDMYPEFTLFYSTNHLPKIVSGGVGIWRRIKNITFERTFSEDEQDKDLANKLKQEAPGILQWIIDGYQLYLNEGLREPSEVVVSTKEYKDNEDLLASWIEDCCKVVPTAVTTTSDLYRNYKQWCEDGGQKPFSRNNFTTKLVEAGYKKDLRRLDGYINPQRVVIGLKVCAVCNGVNPNTV